MISLTEFINNVQVNEDLSIINAEIISESLNAQVLRDLAKQLKQQGKDKQSWTQSKSFADIFGYLAIEWDKIADSDIEVIPAIEGDDKNRNSVIRKVIQGKEEGIVIGQDPETKKFILYICTWHQPEFLYKPLNIDHTYRWRKMTQREQLDFFKGLTVYYINLAGKSARPKRDVRIEAKSGIVHMDENSLKRIAANNVERYQKIIEQNKARALNNDALIDAAKEVIDKTAEISNKLAKDPTRYADMIYNVENLVKACYMTQSYTKSGQPIGINGILPTLMRYTKSLSQAASGQAIGEYTTQNIKNAKDDLEKTVNSANKLIAEIEPKMK